MTPRTLFRTDGHVIQTRSARNWPWILFALTFVLALFGYAAALDHADEVHQAQLDQAVANAFEVGRMHGHAEMVDSARAAWQAAQAEADRCRRGP